MFLSPHQVFTIQGMEGRQEENGGNVGLKQVSMKEAALIFLMWVKCPESYVGKCCVGLRSSQQRRAAVTP